jgi:chemotaxis protein MotB
MARKGSDESGVAVYPPLPVPKSGGAAGRDSDARIRHTERGGGGFNKKALVVVLLLGGAAGFAVRTYALPDGKIFDLQQKLNMEHALVASAHAHADELQTDLDTAQAAKKTAEARVQDAESAKNQLADKAADAEKKAKDAADAETKLRATIDKATGSVTSEGDEIHLRLVDKVLFKIGDDQLTPSGKAALDKVAVALKELSDKQIWVQGHTDDQPIIVPPAPPPKKPAKGAAAPPPPEPRFRTNWELSAARALQVVHYLQDVSHIEPTRLAALAFGQYRPVSQNKALNRRIEIVLVPKREVLAK